MASFTGIDADAATTILEQSVVSGSINPSGHLILVRGNGVTIDAGDFSGIIADLVDDAITAGLATAIPPAIAGKVVDKGNITGALSFTADFNKDNLPNAMVKAVLTGNITVNASSAFPASPRANTQLALRLTQDATGGRTLTLTGFKKSQGVLNLSTAANAIDIVVFLFDGTQWYAGLMGDAFS